MTGLNQFEQALAAKALSEAIDQQREAIQLCLQRKLAASSLILIYAMMDNMASLDRSRKHHEADRGDFVAWVSRYVLPGSGLKCTALDLYAARCGLLHAYSPDSTLSRTGKAMQIWYAWGTADEKQLKQAILISKRPCRCVHVGTLFSALNDGVSHFCDDLQSDPVRLRLVLSRANKIFGNLTKDLLAEALQYEALPVSPDATTT